VLWKILLIFWNVKMYNVLLFYMINVIPEQFKSIKTIDDTMKNVNKTIIYHIVPSKMKTI